MTPRDVLQALAGRRIAYGAIAFFLALAPIAIIFTHRAVAPMVILLGLAAALDPDIWRAAKARFWNGRDDAAGFGPDWRDPGVVAAFAFGAFCLWAALSAIWSPRHDPTLALNVLTPIFSAGGIIFVLLKASRARAISIARIYTFAVGAAAILIMAEGLSGGALRDFFPPADNSHLGHKDITGLGRGLAVLIPMAFPGFALLYWGVRKLVSSLATIGLMMLALTIAALSFDIAANLVALFVGGFAALAGLAAPKLSIKLVTFTTILVLIATPFIAAGLPVDGVMAADTASMPVSWLQRLAIWRTAGDLTLAGLPWGYGADFAREFSRTAPMIAIPGSPIELSTMATHPHSVFLQIWLEFGLPGVALISIFILAGGRALWRAGPSRTTAAALAGAAAAIFVSFAVEASLWQVWRLAAIGLAGFGVALSYCLNHKRIS